MKRFFFFIGILFCCSLMIAQQETSNDSKIPNDSKRVLFGVSAGPTVDWFEPTSKGIARVKSKAGFMTGINVDVNLTQGSFFYFSTGTLFRYLQGDLMFNYEHKHFGVVTVERTYQTMYLTVPTGVTFRISTSKQCIIIGKLGLYHNFKVGGERFDSFTLPGEDPVEPYFYVTTKKEKNEHAALFAESAYAGLGFEYMFKNNLRVFTTLDYSCQFNYFNSNARSEIYNPQFKTLIHSFNIVFGFMF